MTIRERIADWISGGALTRARDDTNKMKNEAVFWREEAYSLMVKHTKNSLVRCLHRIADCETTSANATVRRMARIAREAME